MGLFEDIAALGLQRGYDRYVVALEPVLQAMSKRGIPVSPAAHAHVTTVLDQALADLHADMQALVPDAAKKLTKWKRKPNVRLPFKPSTQQLIGYMRFRGHAVPRAFKSDKETTAELELKRLAKSTGDPLYSKVIEYREIQTLLRNHVKNWAPGADGRVHPTFYYETGTGQLGARRPNSMNAPRHKANQGDIFRSMIVAKEGHTLVELDYKAFHVQTLAFEARDGDLLRLAKLDIHSFLTAHFLRIPGADRLVALQDAELAAELGRIKKQHKAVRDAKVKHALLGYNNGMGYRKCYYQYMEFFDGQNESKRIFELLDSLFPKARLYRKRVCRQAASQGYLISRFGCIRWFWEVYKGKRQCRACHGLGCAECEGTGWEGEPGEEHEAALSFFTQNDAHCHLKEAMLRLNKRWHISTGPGSSLLHPTLVEDDALAAANGRSETPPEQAAEDCAGPTSSNEKYGLINPIHDALMFEVPDEVLGVAIPAIAAEMERPSEVLVDSEVAPGGLAVEVGVSVGKQWNRMTDVDWRSYGRDGTRGAGALA